MSLILAGSGWRGHKDRTFIWRQLDLMRDRGHDRFRFGCAPGFDEHCRAWARARRADWDEYKADWDKLGKAAGWHRNDDMLCGKLPGKEPEGPPDLLLAMPQPGVHNGKDSGTFMCIKLAVKYGIGVWIPPYAREGSVGSATAAV